MAIPRVFIDGEAGTTGLQIAARLGARQDLELLRIDPQRRKEAAARRAALNAADVAILCLPDEAARDAVALIDNATTRVIDASTAHRVADGWTYGFPELDDNQRERLRTSMRISNPGCYAIAAVSILAPLTASGLLPANWPLSITGTSGYSGGGKSLIASFEDASTDAPIDTTVYDYGLTLAHKHVPEITCHGGLDTAPIFLPTVGSYYKGMLVHVPLALGALPSKPRVADVHDVLAERYADERFVSVVPPAESRALARLEPEALNDTNELHLHVLYNEERGHAMVVAQLDNLGKGASGQAVQTLNLLLGFDEANGL